MYGIQAPLTGADLYDWIALRRVSTGAMAKLGDRWLEGGRHVPGYVCEALTALCERGLVTQSDPEQATDGMARAALTPAGITRYLQLCRRRQSAARMPPAPDPGSGVS
ncbi:MAG TPA: hypothetical protein VGL88_02775 [Pseudonocardiaceae bacterium]